MYENLTFQDTKKLLIAIQKLYALQDLSSFGRSTLAILDQLIPSEVPQFCLTNLQTRTISHTFLPSYPGLTPEMEKIPQRYWREHPIVQNMPRTLQGAYKISDFITPAKLHQLEGLYHQFLRVMHCEEQMTLFLPPSQSQRYDAETCVTIALHRSQRSFTERDRFILNLLRPHLLQAYYNVQQYHQTQQSLSQLHQSLNPLGLVILNGSGQIQWITPLAEQWLQTYFVTFTPGAQLPNHLWAWLRHQLSRLTNDALLTPPLPLRIEQGDKQLVIRLVIEQIGERYLLLLEEQTLSWLNSLELLGLSHREAEVLFWVIRGKDNLAIAHQLGLQLSTVRKHLENIYRKLNVQSRAEAIAQAVEKLGILNSPPLV